MKNFKILILLIMAFQGAQTQTKNFIDQPYIEVSGTADTLVTPNEIFIRIVLAEKDTRDRVSIEELERRMVSALTMLGLDTEKALTTAGISSNFKFYLLKSRDVLKTKLYTLKVDNAVMATQVFIKLEELDISNTSIDRVEHSDLENIRNIMRTYATANAKKRAVALTQPLNQTVGVAIHIADAENYSQLIQGKASGIQIRGLSSVKMNEKDLPKIEFEKIKVTANINVKFVLK